MDERSAAPITWACCAAWKRRKSRQKRRRGRSQRQKLRLVDSG